jgi:hypothetical protein
MQTTKWRLRLKNKVPELGLAIERSKGQQEKAVRLGSKNIAS